MTKSLYEYLDLQTGLLHMFLLKSVPKIAFDRVKPYSTLAHVNAQLIRMEISSSKCRIKMLDSSRPEIKPRE